MGYRGSIFSSPSNFLLSLAIFLVRYPNGMLGIAIVLGLTSSGHSYFYATSISAVMWITCSISSPLISRAMDKFGYQKILYPAAACFVAATALFLVVLNTSGYLPLVALTSCIMGAFIPSYGGSAIRGMWHSNFSGKTLQAAVAWEGVLDDLMYTFGPMLAVFLFYKFGRSTMYIVIMAIVALGMAIAPKKHSLIGHIDVHRSAKIKLVSKIFLLLVCFSVFYGAIFGSIDVDIIARYRELGASNLAGVAVGAYALSSALGAFLYGYLPVHNIRPIRQFKIMVPIMVLAMLPFSVWGVREIWSIFLTLIIAGFVVSPTTIIINSLLREVVQRRRFIEATSWIYSSLNLGTALGSLSVGHILDKLGAVAGATIPLLMGSIEIIVVLYIKRNWIYAGETS